MSAELTIDATWLIQTALGSMLTVCIALYVDIRSNRKKYEATFAQLAKQIADLQWQIENPDAAARRRIANVYLRPTAESATGNPASRP